MATPGVAVAPEVEPGKLVQVGPNPVKATAPGTAGHGVKFPLHGGGGLLTQGSSPALGHAPWPQEICTTVPAKAAVHPAKEALILMK